MTTQAIHNAEATESKELTNSGLSLKSWKEILGGSNEAASQEASEALLQMGLELAKDLPSLAIPLQRLKGAARAKAATELGLMGIRLLSVVSRYREALRSVILTDRDEAIRTSAIHALAQLGPANNSQVPALVDALKDDLPNVRVGAAQDLAQLGSEARESVPVLISTCLNDSDLAVRVHAGVALWHVNKRSHPSMSALIEGLKSGDQHLVWIAAECLGDMGKQAIDAVPALLEALAGKPVNLIATTIVMALESIDPKTAASVSLS